MPESIVEQAISKQNPFDLEITFPMDSSQIKELTKENYLEYFSRLEIFLASRKTHCESLILKSASQTTIFALHEYLLKTKDLRFKELVIQSAPSEDLSALPLILKFAAEKGLTSFNLKDSNLNEETAGKIFKEVVTNSISMDIILPPKYTKIQKELDEHISNFQRKKRIEEFGKEKTITEPKLIDQNRTKRSRNIKNTRKIYIDTEMEIEVAIEKSVEKSIEADLEYEFGDKSELDLIDKDKFINLISEGKFKAPLTEKVKKRPGSVWDCWLGNISQLVVEPRPRRMQVQINANTDKISGVKTSYCISIIKSISGEPMRLVFTEGGREHRIVEDYAPTIDIPKSDPDYEKKLIQKFIKHFYPEVTDNKYPPKDISDEDWKIWKHKDLPLYYRNIDYSEINEQGEQWKGEYVVDTNTLASAEEETLENLLKTCPLNPKLKDPILTRRFFPNLKIPFMTKAACEKLLEHSNFLEFGLDFEHLPAGFEIKECKYQGKLVVALDYSKTKANIKKKDTYALNFIKPETLPALPEELIKIWLSLPGTPQDEPLKEQYKSLLDPYDRPKVQNFKRSLPAMLSNSESLNYKEHLLYKFLDHFKEAQGLSFLEEWQQQLSVGDLNRLLAVYTEFGVKGLLHLDKVWKTAIKLAPEDKTDTSILKSLQSNYFPKCKTFLPCLDPNFEAAITIIKGFSEDELYVWENLFQQHCEAVGFDNLYNLVKVFQTFKTSINSKNLSFPKNPEISKIKSLPLALSRIMTILNATSIRDLPLVWEGIFKLDLNSNGAIKVISDAELNPLGGALILPEMQMEAKNYKEEHDYSTFSDYLGPVRYFFLGPPNHGYDSLQVTHSLSAHFHKEAKDQVFYDNFTYGFRDWGMTQNLSELFACCKTEEELKKNYYRFLATRPYRKSLDFYQKAISKIDNHLKDFKTRAVFYSMIASSTSSFESSFSEENETEILDKVQELLTHYTKINYSHLSFTNNEQLRLHILDKVLEHLSPLQSLDFLNIFFSTAETMLRPYVVNSREVLRDRVEQVDKFACTINGANRYQKSAVSPIYAGLKFLNSTSSADFIKFCNTADYLSSYIHGRGDILGVSNSLIKLISTFQLNEKTRDTIDASEWGKLLVTPSLKFPGTSSKSEIFTELVSPSLDLLAKVKTNIHPDSKKKLTEKDLIDFISILHEAYKKDPKLDVNASAISLVKEHFASYFEPDFFYKLSNLATGELPKEILSLIQVKFTTHEEQELIKLLLNSFYKLEDVFHRENTIKAILKICTQLPDNEREQFLKTLATINKSKNSKLEELYILLLFVGERGSVSDFMFIMKHYASVPSIPLILTFYKEALPLIYLKKYGTLRISELQVLAADLLEHLEDKFVDKFKEILASLTELSINYPNEKTLVLTIISNFIKEKNTYDVSRFVANLCKLDKEVLRSVCDYYLPKPSELYKLFESLEKLSVSEQNQILSMQSSLANNGKKPTVKEVENFISAAKSNSELFSQAKSCFKTPPYPDFSLLTDWASKKTIESDYSNYQKTPCKREATNGFKKNQAEKYAAQFKGLEFEPQDLADLHKATEAVKDKAIAELTARLNALKADEQIERVAILAELLYRSKGIDKDESKEIKGNSYELNTVQYLAVLAYLKTGGHITAEMATGEGKSRTMMLALACQVSMGKTVDFVTADMQLAERDYLEYQAFFKIIGAETSLIYSTSAPETYKKKGINFSDASNLSLFRNKARSSSKEAADLVIDENPKNRALIIDEADKTYFDISETRFNYSAQPTTSETKDMEWVYPLLIKFFTQKDVTQAKLVAELYKEDIDKCNEAFFDFARAQQGFTDEMLIQLQNLSQAQLETWQESAITALSLKLGEDYTLEPNIIIETTKGPKLVSEAKLIYGSRIAPNSKFSFGVHQCLHAYLNEELKNPKSATSVKCKELIQKNGKEDAAFEFHIEAEKQIIYSSTSKSLLDEYQKGDVWGITGTAGAIIEREEAALLYAKDATLMKFITIPRREELKRVDKPIRVTKNFNKRIETILEYILEAQTKGRPTLLIAESDYEAKKIYDALQTLAAEKIPENSWLFVDALTSAKEEKAKIAEAGKPGMITISTKRLGRGTDIKIEKDVEEKGGLRVIGTFLPRDRDLNQIFGRAGRYGDKGDARLVVDKEQLKKSFKSKSLKSGFFLSTEFFIKSKQAQEDKKQQVERLIRQVLSDFRVKITDEFFSYYDKKDASMPITARDDWTKCTKAMDQHWSKAWPYLQEELAKPKIDMTKISTHLEEFRTNAQKEWAYLNGKLGGVLKDLDNLELSPITTHLLKTLTPKRLYTVEDRTQVYKAYDKALDGRAVIYDALFVEFKSIINRERKIFANTRAFLNGTGIAFADSRAILSGKRPLFANLRAWIAKSPEGKKELQLKTKSILEALEKHKQHELKQLLRTEDARSLIKPVKGDIFLGLKIELTELVLSYLHKKTKISAKDMDKTKELLDEISKFTSLPEIKKLPLKGRFFSSTLKKELKHIIEDNEKYSPKTSF